MEPYSARSFLQTQRCTCDPSTPLSTTTDQQRMLTVGQGKYHYIPVEDRVDLSAGTSVA